MMTEEQINDYKVSLEIFEGPLDLLLYLVKKEEVDIFEIDIVKVIIVCAIFGGLFSNIT